MYKILGPLEKHEIPKNGSVEPVVRTTIFFNSLKKKGGKMMSQLIQVMQLLQQWER